MIAGAIETITEEVLSRLVSNGVPESRTLEFKRDLPGGANDDKKEFLADVTAFANTLGGDLIYGIDEAGGIASAADGVVVEDKDAAQLRLEQLLRDGVEPRLASVRPRSRSAPSKTCRRSWMLAFLRSMRLKGVRKRFQRQLLLIMLWASAKPD